MATWDDIKENVASNGNVVTVLFTEGGGVEDTPAGGYYRTLHWNTGSGHLVLRGEYHHGLDLAGHYWWCTVGNALAHGDIRAQLELPGNDDSAELPRRTMGFRSTQLASGRTGWRTSRV